MLSRSRCSEMLQQLSKVLENAQQIALLGNASAFIEMRQHVAQLLKQQQVIYDALQMQPNRVDEAP